MVSVIPWLAFLCPSSSGHSLLGKRAARRACALMTESSQPSPGEAAPPRGETGTCVVVAGTREESKNGKLKKALSDIIAPEDFEFVEVPCIAAQAGPDRERLVDTLAEEGRRVGAGEKPRFGYAAVTSPEGANVFLECLRSASLTKCPIPVTAVGKSTAEILAKAGVEPVFVPSKATAETLAAELPSVSSSSSTSSSSSSSSSSLSSSSCPGRVLYPTSNLSLGTLERLLKERGFEVTRLETYATVTAQWDEEKTQSAARTQIATFGSPSSVRNWVEKLSLREGGRELLSSQAAACIGETSGRAAEKMEVFREVVWPEKPGMDAWARLTADLVVAHRRRNGSESSPHDASRALLNASPQAADHSGNAASDEELIVGEK
uniref:Uroporphyrinogen-III synthase n=1 Tax=Chromera velia TaxID=505693 RepID=G4W923_9ALVE|nr:uroporphyrinogen-III synthase [Chromera velia]